MFYVRVSVYGCGCVRASVVCSGVLHHTVPVVLCCIAWFCSFFPPSWGHLCLETKAMYLVGLLCLLLAKCLAALKVSSPATQLVPGGRHGHRPQPRPLQPVRRPGHICPDGRLRLRTGPALGPRPGTKGLFAKQVFCTNHFFWNGPMNACRGQGWLNRRAVEIDGVADSKSESGVAGS